MSEPETFSLIAVQRLNSAVLAVLRRGIPASEALATLQNAPLDYEDLGFGVITMLRSESEPDPTVVTVELLAELFYVQAVAASYPALVQQEPWYTRDKAVQGWWLDLARAEAQRGYRLLGPADAPEAIQCLRCGATSHSAGDVGNRYCGRCKAFHSEEGA